jgi:hypothetical protein
MRGDFIAKSCFVSFVPFISSHQIGSMPRPDHLSRLCFLLRYFGLALARVRPAGVLGSMRSAFLGGPQPEVFLSIWVLDRRKDLATARAFSMND